MTSSETVHAVVVFFVGIVATVVLNGVYNIITETKRQWYAQRQRERFEGSVRSGKPWHMLKTWLGPFEAVLHNKKHCEIRREDDRFFEVGDIILLQEWDEVRKVHTGRSIMVTITHIIRGPEWDVPVGMVVMSIERM
jgi:hypothetical protein